MKRKTKKMLYRKAKEWFQKTYMFIWVLSGYFAIAVHRFDTKSMKLFLKIFFITSFLAIPKIIIYFKVENNRNDIYEMIKRG